MAQTISNTESNTVTLDGGNGYEVIVLDGGAIYGSGGAGVYGANGGEVFNDGLIEGGAGAASGAGNAGQGYAGIELTQPGIIANQGTISGGAGGVGIGVNGGTGGVGVSLSGGLLTNSGLISGGFGGLAVTGALGAIGAGGAGGAGVYVNGGTLVNAGIILGGFGLNGANGDAVRFGSAAGTLVVDPGAVFKGLVVANTQADDVLELGVGNGNQGTLSGLGSQYTGFSTFTEDSGANWLLAGSNSFGGTATIGGTLAIAGGTLSAANGVSLYGSMTVGAGAALVASGTAAGVTASRGAHLLVDGSIAGGAGSNGSFATRGAGGGGGAGISLSGGSTAMNTGTVTGGGGGGSYFGGTGGAGISLSGGSTAMNTGTVTGGGGGGGYSGGTGGAGISLSGGGMATNDGTVTGGSGGVGNFYSGGGGGAGVYIDGGTFINAGTIGGGSGGTGFVDNGAAGDAVQFGSAAGTLVVDPGAVFKGLVVANTQADDVLELGVGNGNQGTLSGLGSQYTGFSTFTEDSGANWLLAGSNSFGGTATIGGTLAIAGSLAASNGVSLTGRLTVDAGASLVASYYEIGVTASSGAYLLVHGTVAGGGGGKYGGTGGDGILLSGGMATNDGMVTGGAGQDGGTGGAGISLSGGMATNDGTVTGGGSSKGAGGIGPSSGGTGGAGISLSGGTATNDGMVTGGAGCYGSYSGGAGGAGISLSGGGLATNDGTVTGGGGGGGGIVGGAGGSGVGGVGGAGVYSDGGTLINAGTIGGGSGGSGGLGHGATGAAVQFGSAAGTLVVDPGAVFNGLVVANTQADDVLELGVGNGNQGTLSGLGSQYTGFSTFTEDSGANWLLAGSNSFGGTAAIGGTLDLTGGTLSAANGVSLSGSLTVGAGAALVANGTAAAVTASRGAHLLVDGTVTGGAGSYGYNHGGTGGAGISLSGGSLSTNGGKVTGGVGGQSNGEAGTGGAGISLSDGGMATNHGTVTGGRGGYSTVICGAGGAGISLSGGGMATNDGTVTGGGGGGFGGFGVGGAGGAGVYLDGGTLINAGTIGGGSGGSGGLGHGATGDAVQFGSAAGTLLVDPGAVFNGLVVANTQADDVLELSGTTAATLDGIGTNFANFSTLSFDPGTEWTVEGTAAGLAAIAAITGLESGDELVIDNFVEGGFTYSDGQLVLTEASDPVTLNIEGDYTQQSLDVSTDGTNTTIEVLCFLRGTGILTPIGEIPVEDLKIGDPVFTLRRGVQPIRWIGTGKLMVPAGHRSPATPVIVRRGAIAENVPHRDLYLTKGHALHIQGAFIPAEFLVNHRSIVWDDATREVEFYHIELPSHEVMVADGAPTESYRDEGNRWMFANANPAWDQPGVAPHAPVLTGGAKLDAIWRRLLDRSGQRLEVPTTTDPDLHLLVDGARIDGCEQADGDVLFHVPPLPRSVVIASRAACQDELGRARDPRRLGVAIASLVLGCGYDRRVMGAEALAAYPGSHAYEAAEDCTWTDGALHLPAVLFTASAKLQIRLRHTTQYPLAAVRAA